MSPQETFPRSAHPESRALVHSPKRWRSQVFSGHHGIMIPQCREPYLRTLHSPECCSSPLQPCSWLGGRVDDFFFAGTAPLPERFGRQSAEERYSQFGRIWEFLSCRSHMEVIRQCLPL